MILHEFLHPIPVLIKLTKKEAYAIYVVSGGTFENDIWTVVLCETSEIIHCTTQQLLMHKNATMGIEVAQQEPEPDGDLPKGVVRRYTSDNIESEGTKSIIFRVDDIPTQIDRKEFVDWIKAHYRKPYESGDTYAKRMEVIRSAVSN